MFRKSESKKEIEQLQREYRTFLKSQTEKVIIGEISPEEATEEIETNHRSTIEKIEELNRSELGYRLKIFNEMKTPFLEVDPNKNQNIVRGSRGIFESDNRKIDQKNKTDMSKIQTELAGSSFAIWGLTFTGNSYERLHLSSLKALITSQYILIRQNKQLMNILQDIHKTLEN